MDHLFVKEDGSLQGWLAALLCCWAAVNEDEHPIEKPNISKPTTARNTIWNEQPTPLKPIHYFPTDSSSPSMNRKYNKSIESASFDENDRVRPISERPPSLRPLSLAEPSLLDRIQLHQSRRKSSTNLQMRMSISRPTDFRRLEYTEKQRISLKPLQLSPVVLRDVVSDTDLSETPLNRFSRSVDDLAEPANRDSYRASRGTPFERCQLLSSSPSSSAPSASVTESGQIVMEPAKPPQVTKPVFSTRSSSSSLRSLRRQAIESSASAVSTPARPSTERVRLKRKRSSQKNSGDSSDLDREILELNTIVEEHRAESARQQNSGEGHVAAVAPLMSVRARSETLTDIGSAFSRPLISVSTSTPDITDPQISPVEVAPVKSRLSRPLDMPDPMAFEQVAQQERLQRPNRRPSSKVAGWLSNLLGSSSSSSANDSCQTSLRGRAVSESSLCTTGTELDSPMVSSPMSKGGHSRSLTAESRLTPISPPSTVDEDPELVSQGKEPEPWPMFVRHPSQVGLAF